MDAETSQTADTRDRLLEAARRTFAEKGYHHATVAEICERGRANIAAVNYYFRHKENLYAEAWRQAFARSVAKHPPDGGVPADAPPEQRLRGRIRALIERVADPESDEFDIVHKELANPTGLLTEAMHEAIEPVRQGMASVIQELLGPSALPLHARLCEKSIISQCLHFMMRERFQRLLPEGVRPPGPPPLDVDLDTIIDHVSRFCLAGIHAVRRHIESGASRKSE